LKKAISLIVSMVLIIIVFSVYGESCGWRRGSRNDRGGGLWRHVCRWQDHSGAGHDQDTGHEISGTIELLTGTDFTTLVRKDVVLPQNTEKQFTLFMMASPSIIRKDFEVKLKSGGATVASATPKTVSGVDPDKQLCGVLSDDPAAVSYMKKVTFSQYGTKNLD